MHGRSASRTDRSIQETKPELINQISRVYACIPSSGEPPWERRRHFAQDRAARRTPACPDLHPSFACGTCIINPSRFSKSDHSSWLVRWSIPMKLRNDSYMKEESDELTWSRCAGSGWCPWDGSACAAYSADEIKPKQAPAKGLDQIFRSHVKSQENSELASKREIKGESV